MSERISLSLSPIGHWALVLLASLAVVALTLWPYQQRIRHSPDRRKYVVIGLRMAAVLLALLAMLRPSLLMMRKVKQQVSVIFMLDSSTSMKIQDEVNNASRYAMAVSALAEGRATLDGKGDEDDLQVKLYRFDGSLHPGGPDPAEPEPTGLQTALGANLLEAVRREAGAPIASLVLLTDGASNQGVAPLTAAQTLRAQGIPITAVGFGSAAAAGASRDIAVTGLQAPEAVFVKNDVEVRGALRVRGFPGQTLDVELMAEGYDQPVARAQVKVPADSEVVATPALRFTPQSADEKLLTIRVAPREGELIASNNEFSTFVTVLPGGLDVLHLQGPGTIWEGKFTTRALDESREIQSQLKVLLGPDDRLDEDFAPGAHDVYVLGDVPADYLTPVQHQLLAQSVSRGAGLIMLGGRDSLGDGGWGATPLAEQLPTYMRRGDGQIEPEGGLKVVPNPTALASYVLQLGGTPQETAAIWEALPPIPGASAVGAPKEAAVVWALTPDGRPLMVARDAPGRTIVYGGETWPWYRASLVTKQAHQKFWRQAILWLSHQEDQSDSSVVLKLDRRRVPVGGAVELSAIARDEQARPVPGAKFETTVTPPGGAPVPVDLFNQGDASRGSFSGTEDPGVYNVEVVGKSADGAVLGRATSRFLVYQDDQELENPAANIALLQQLAELTEGQFLRVEQLDRYLGGLDPSAYSQVLTQKEYRLWDNWPFLLSFVGVLGVEWWLRKRMGWV